MEKTENNPVEWQDPLHTHKSTNPVEEHYLYGIVKTVGLGSAGL